MEEELSEMWAELGGGESSSTRLRILNLWVWVSKALLMRGHPSGLDTATKVQLLLANTFDVHANESFSIFSSYSLSLFS